MKLITTIIENLKADCEKRKKANSYRNYRQKLWTMWLRTARVE